jgi:hypothetical protein
MRHMQIQKRSMNWLPRASLFNEAEAARLKRKAQAQDDIAKGEALASGFIGGMTSNTGEQINLTLRIAASRIQTQAQEKQKELLSSVDLTS